ncbi:VOC family protein [Sphingomonas montanisoli]|uniref:VOC family protein n=1 Tax=Sphingomonas montanisoli TaxID=2606412 RepID=A0A5D9C504_9SPHN|nr:VOC family protein [Sphingomonas montanisoli]TZG25055.1 VOC family protein [Sphingomonas montanisoli]
MSQHGFGQIDQIGYLVENLDAAIQFWIDRFGVGPWTVFRNVPLDGVYRGQAGTVTIDVGLSYQGNVQIELIEATNDTPSPYRDADGRRLLGIHHTAHIVDDLDAAVAKASGNGLRVVFEASNPATRVAYLASDNEPGLLAEFIMGPGMREMADAGIAAAKMWDGSNPVVEMTA